MRNLLATGFALVMIMLAIVGTAGAMGGMTDKTAPVISNIQPTGTISGSSTTVSASYSDSGMMASGINTTTATLTVSGASVSGCSADTLHISCTASSLVAGLHTISVSVKDNAGNTGTATGTFTVAGPDTTVPTITNILPSGTITGSSTTVSADYSDAGSGINATTALLTVSGATVSGCTADALHISCTASGLAVGPYTISVSVADNSGNTSTATGSFTVATGGGPDTTAPAITNILPSGTITGSTAMVSADYSDAGSGINASTAALNVSGATVSGCTAGAANISCTASGLAAGPYTISVSVADNSGNTGTATGSFTVAAASGPDTAAPVITNIQPSGTIYTSSTTISADYSDPAPSGGIDSSSAMIHLDGRMLFTGCVATETHVSCPKSGLSIGTHTAEIYITDVAGHTGSATGTFIVAAAESTPPVITNIQPSGTVTGSTTTVSADYSDAGSGINASTAALTVSGATVSGCTAGAANISCTASGLAAGPYTISVSVADNSGNTGTATGSFTVAAGSAPDTTVPAITNILPTGTITGSSATVSASYADAGSGINAATAALTVSGATVSGCTADTINISCTASGLAAGPYTISVTVADNSGNIGMATGSFTVAAGSGPDTTPPTVTSVTPANGSTMYTNGSSTVYYQLGNTTPLVIKADYSDEAGGSGVDETSVMVHLDGGNMLGNCPVQTTTHVECVATAADLLPGTHTLDIYVADLAGNLTVNPTTVIVALDNQAPTYSNLFPANGSTILTSQLNSTGVNDLLALRIDYDLADAAPSSGYSPMTHINESVPPGVAGAMISNSSCVKTPATNPTHYSCQMNRAALLHLGDNTLSVLLKDKVGNASSDYSDPAGLKHYTVVDNVAPALSGLTANATTISANYSDPNPTGANSAILNSGINAATAMVHVDGAMIMMGCTATATGISCPTPSGLSVGTHSVEVMVADNAVNNGMATGSLTIDPPPCTPGKPSLSLSRQGTSWASYAEYLARELTVQLAVNNTGADAANSVAITGATSTNGVTLSTPVPIALGTVAGGASAATTVKYHVPVTTGSFKTSFTASASDTCGTSYTYPV
ncbi:MAG: hypothetical protein WC911_03370 [Thermoleophilia bacterium]